MRILYIEVNYTIKYIQINYILLLYQTHIVHTA